MEIIKSIILGIVQGLTEFLPISSSAHLEVIPYLFGWEYWGKCYDVSLHLGTFLGVLYFYRREALDLVINFFKGLKNMRGIAASFELRLPWLVLLSSFPTMVIAFLCKDLVGKAFDPESFPQSIAVSALLLIVFGLILGFAEMRGAKTREADSLSLFDAFLIGVFQALAIMPGVSRSGITMTCGLLFGLKKERAAYYSFLISLPVIGGAAFYEGYKFFNDPQIISMWLIFLVGVISSTISGFFVIKFLLDYLKKGSFKIFVYYRIALGIIILVVFFWKLRGLQ